MRLTHTFELPAPLDQVFGVLGHLDLLAPCFPGASVWGQDGDVYHGAVKIKFGPFPLVFEGTARVVRVDAADHRLVMRANARDRRGAAAGAATVTATCSAVGTDRTSVTVLTELDLTGRPAQLGSGTISSVSDKLAGSFVGCLSAKLAAGLSVPESTDDAGAAETTATPVAGEAESTPVFGRPTEPSYGYRPPQPDPSAPHLQVLPAVLRSWLPIAVGAAAGIAALLIVVRRLRRR